MASKIKGLQQWCHRRTDGYRDVHVGDMTSSWRDGLAFCAIIHRYRPDLIDFDSLSKENILENNQLAFEVAEKELDIPAFLDAPDMVRMKKPDKLSIITYVSQYYNYFNDKPELGGPGVSKAGARGSNSLKRPSDNNKHITSSNEQNKSKTSTLGDRCAICDGKVYLLERHVDNNTLYHRLCFRHSAMSPTNKVYNSLEKDTSNASKVRKIEHKSNGNAGGKKLFADNKNLNSSKTPSKYHDLAQEFLSRENGTETSKDKQFMTSTPKSKYEDKASLTVVSTKSESKPQTSVLDSKSRWTTNNNAVQTAKSKDEPKFSVSNKITDSDKNPLKFGESRAKQMSKMLETQEPKPETPKSGLRDFLKKYHEQGDQNKTAATAKTFDKMEVDDIPSPRSKLRHNVTDKQDNPVSWKSAENSSGAKSPFNNRKYNLQTSDTKSKLTETKPNALLSSSTGLNKTTNNLSNKSALDSYKTQLSKPSDKDTSISKYTIGNKDINKPSRDFKPSLLSDETANKPLEIRNNYKSKTEKLNDSSAANKGSEFKNNLGSKAEKLNDSSNKKPYSLGNKLQNLSDSLANKPLNSKDPSNSKSSVPSETSTSTSKSKFSDISVTKPSVINDTNKLSKLSDLSSKSTVSLSNERTSNFTNKLESKSDSALSGFNKTKDLPNKYSKDLYPNSKNSEPSKQDPSPVPKPRGILKTSRTEEDMDVSETTNAKSSLNLKPTASPRAAVNKITTIKEETRSPARPKSPVLSRLKLSTISSSDNANKTSPRVSTPESPPPLPFSPPPSISTPSPKISTPPPNISTPPRKISSPPVSPPERRTQIEIKSAISKSNHKHPTTISSNSKMSEDTPPPLPRKSYLQHEEAPPLPPRQTLKIVSQETFVIGQNDAPPKPPRSLDRNESPMKMDQAINKAMSPQTSPEAVAVLVSPSAKSDQTVLGSLLKSLAGVRQKSPPETSKPFNFKPQSGYDSKLVDSKTPNNELVKLRQPKHKTSDSPAPVLNLMKKKEPERPKSVHSVLDSYNNNKTSDEVPSWKRNLDSKTSSRPKSVAMVTSQVEDEVPSWKKNLELKQAEKSRSKSEASMDEDFGKLTWQRDAAKRMAKNKTFVDPEFEKLKQGKDDRKEDNLNMNNLTNTNGLAVPHDKRKLPESPSSYRPTMPINNKKAPERPKSPVKYTHNPEPVNNSGFRSANQIDVDKKNHNNKYRVYPDLTNEIKPSNPPLRKITPNFHFDFDKSTDLENSFENRNNNPVSKLTSPKPPPIKLDISPRHYTPFEIRSDLIDIDNKLTELELRGRQLEDTIRSATTSEGEDDLLNEWFKLINEKNDLIRQEADLIYINREQELEDEQDSIDSRLRHLMSIPDINKTQDERDEEDHLINKKIDVINQRSNIVDSMDEDRIRYEEEDRDIEKVLNSKGFVKTEDEESPIKKLEEKKKKKQKKQKKLQYV